MFLHLIIFLTLFEEEKWVNNTKKALYRFHVKRFFIDKNDFSRIVWLVSY